MAKEEDYEMSYTHTLAGHVISSSTLELLDSILCPGGYLRRP